MSYLRLATKFPEQFIVEKLLQLVGDDSRHRGES